MKKYLYTFVFFACAIMISRHIVADLKQEERLFALEQQVTALQAKLWESRQQETTEQSAPTSKRANSKNNRETTGTNRKATTSTLANDDRNKQVWKPEKRAFDTLKFSTPILMELNAIDSATLTKVPGIGAKSASMIVRYRSQLGGFVSPYQLAEKLTWDGAQERMDEWCTLWFKTDTALIHKINVNSADFRQILRHPYITYEQTKALVNYRDKHRRISGIEVLRMLEEFSEEDIARLMPYLAY